MKKRVISLLLALVLTVGLLPTTVLADWGGFRGNDGTNLGITNVKTPISTDYAKLNWAAKIGTSASEDMSSSTIYAGQPVIWDGALFVTAGSKLYKLSLTDGSVLKEATMAAQDSYGTTPPTVSGGIVYVSQKGGRMQAFNAQTLASVWTAQNLSSNGQNSCPILVSNGRVYTGYWSTEEAAQNFVCLDAANGTVIWKHENKGGYYWAGAVAVGDYIFVGTDDGQAAETNGTSQILSFRKDQTTGTPAKTLALTGLGDVRSSLAVSGGRVYFTTKGGYLCSAKADGTTGELSDLQTLLIGASTSTPVVYGGFVYVGVGTGSGPNGSFAIVKEDAGTKALSLVKKIALSGSAQGSVLLTTAYANDGYLYFYECFNEKPGGMDCIRVNAADPSLAEAFTLYDAQSYEQYCTASPICDDAGNLYFSNNSGHVFSIGRTEAPAPKFTEQPQSAKYRPGTQAQALRVTVTTQITGTTFTYQWQKSADKAAWENISGADKDTYTPEIPESLDTPEQTVYYRCVVTAHKDGKTASDASQAAAITIKMLSDDTSFYYAVNAANQAPDDETGDSKYVRREPVHVTQENTVIDMSKERFGTGPSQYARIWFRAPENGKILSVTIVSSDPQDQAKGFTPAETETAYSGYCYFRKATSALHGDAVIEVKTQAESGTQKTYTLTLKPEIAEAKTQDVYVTIADRGQLKVAQKKISVTDLDADGTFTAEEVLQAVHDLYCKNGFAAEMGDYGRMITKFWGVETGICGYWNNNAMCMSLGDAIGENDHFVAFSYRDTAGWSDQYGAFDKFSYTAKAKQALTLTLSSYSYPDGFAAYENDATTITAYSVSDGALGTKLDEGDYTVESVGNGQYAVTFQNAGSYYLTAENQTYNLIPTVCTVTVSDADAPAEDEITVSFTLLGDSAHEDGTVHTLKDGNLQTWIAETEITLDKDATVLDALNKACIEQAGFRYTVTTNQEKNYVASITREDLATGEKIALGEFTNGQNSGWMFTYNGRHKNLSVSQQTLVEGDAIVFHYTDDHTREEQAKYTPEEVSKLIDEIGEVTRESGTAIDTARAAYDTLTEEEKSQVKNYDKLTEAEKAYAALGTIADWETAYKATGDYLLDQVESGKVTTGSQGGEWMMLGLARSERLYGSDAEDYLQALEKSVKKNINSSGQLKGSTRYLATENARVALAVTALGYDAKDFAGHDLLQALQNTSWVTEQGNNASAYALLALNAKESYRDEQTAKKLVQSLLNNQLSNGGWNITSGSADLDTTAMVVTALAAYRDDSELGSKVTAAIDDALVFLAKAQKASGLVGTSPETTAQVLVALSTLGKDAAADAQFTKGGKTLLDGLLQFYVEGGGFANTTKDAAAGKINKMSTEQAYYALAAYARMKSGKSGLYSMDDAKQADDAEDLAKILEEIEATEVTKADRETYLKLQELARKVKKLKDEQSRAQAEEALKQLQDTYQELLKQEKEKAQAKLSKTYQDVVDDAGEDALDKDTLEDLRKILAQAEDDINDASHSDEMTAIIKQAKTDLENALHKIHVTFRLIGDFLHEDEENAHEEYVTWIETKKYAVSSGATVQDLLELALEKAELAQSGAENGYVSAISAPEVFGGYWLSEMDNGANSGWMYTVNGEHPDQALSDFSLEDGDKVIWHYVDDYTSDEMDDELWLKAEDISPETYAREHLGQIAKPVGRGSVTPGLKFTDLGTDVTFTFTPDPGQELIEVRVDGKSIGAPETYTYQNLSFTSRIRAIYTGAMIFTDVHWKDWFYKDVEYVVHEGLFHGTTRTTFSPDAPMTRAMLVTVLYRLAEKPEVSEATGFADVAQGKYYADAIAWAKENGIVSGVSQTSFAPDASLTREQLAAILYRFAQAQGYRTDETAELSRFDDFGRISAYALDALGWANQAGLVNGRSETQLSPQGYATRAEVAAILHRFAENVAK